MILGIGTDLVNITRFKITLQKTPHLVERIFTMHEHDFAESLSASKRIAYYAKRFAAKEAFSKACGTGIGADIGWQDIEVLNDEKGAPVATISMRANAFLKKKFKTKKIQILLSLTDEKDNAMAFVVLEKA